MKGFIYALTSQEGLPDTVIMYNGGARLPVEGSESLEDLKLLESQGSGDFDLWNVSESLRTDGEAFCGRCYKYVCDL